MSSKDSHSRHWVGFVAASDIRDAIRREALEGQWQVIRWHGDHALCEFKCSRLQVRHSIGEILEGEDG